MSTSEEIRSVIARELEVDIASIDGSATFEALGVDSLSLVEMLFAIEDAFHIKISPTAAEHIHCVDDLTRLVDELRAPAPAASLAA